MTPLPVKMIQLGVVLLALASGCTRVAGKPKEEQNRERDELSALWSFYKHTYVRDGRVVSLDEGEITTSEGQSYAMLRAVWANDPWTFDSVWRWTREHLQVRDDKLFAWKWKDQVLDANSATDADVDIALALILASRRFSQARYQEDALAILQDIWAKDVLHIGNAHYVTAGNWAPREPITTLHVAYFAPYAYEVFAGVDPRHPWASLVKSSYDVLRWLYFTKGVQLPPELVYVDRSSGALLLEAPGKPAADFGYDAVPLFWRLAVDQAWFGRDEDALREKVMQGVEQAFRAKQKLLDKLSVKGAPLSELEGLPHLASVHALALEESPELAETLRREKLDALWEKALAGQETPYYLHNWIWFGRAFELGGVRHYDEFLGFLRPFDAAGFASHFLWVLLGATLLLAPFAQKSRALKGAFLLCAFAVAARYLGWRLLTTLNFYEALGPVISVGLLAAEFYSFSTVVLLVLQVGLWPKKPANPGPMPAELPSVDIFIPIYSESLEILDKTLTAAGAMRYANKRIHVCDDSHRESVAQLAAEHGATYIKGPKKHAKAGNLNNAMKLTDGELLVIFDTDHMPVASFLEETVPYFNDPGIGFLQTPHHFYNQDIFQRALRVGSSVANEQDMFNHAIQNGRDSWGGSFFVGSGAVFRRKAMEGVGGFKLLSITEDIHTSQHLHATGWKSTFVDKDLAVGLTAENLAGYLVQRRRWMLGCLQIFFKDNPLLLKGLSLRQRWGYLASLYYFFFPLARVVFWVTPLLYLLFHLHPLFADVSVLMAYLLPYMVVLPLITRALLPGWPRALWGTLYEMVVSFTLLRAMADLVLPARLGFKVTPKGVTSERRQFDFASSRLTLFAALITLGAVAKGLFEFHYFGIEKDAYFFNLGWAGLNFIGLAVALLVAWEAPQRRSEERLERGLWVELEAEGFSLRTATHDVSLSGISLRDATARRFPDELTLRFEAGPALHARLVYSERVGGSVRTAFRYVTPTSESTRALVRLLFSDPAAWAREHDRHTRSALVMLARFWSGVARSLGGFKSRRRKTPRTFRAHRFRLVLPDGARTLWLRDASESGMGLILLGRALPEGTALPILAPGQPIRWGRIVYQRRRLPGLYRVGLAIIPRELLSASAQENASHVYLAA